MVDVDHELIVDSMPFEEAQLNGRIASLIRHLTADLGWDVREEARGALREERLRKPDIVIRRSDAPPVVIENEYTPGTTLEQDCLSRLGYTMEPDGDWLGGEVSVVFALRSPEALRECRHGDEADEKLREGTELEFAVYRGRPGDYDRFPRGGFLRGDTVDLVNFIKPASIPEDIVNQAADALTQGTNAAAAILMRYSATRYNFGAKLGEQLHQPWPDPYDAVNGKQAKADEDARTQTAKMCATMLINALAYQQNLSGHHSEIEDLQTVQRRDGDHVLNKGILLDQWEKILDINYWPIFHIAQELLLDLPMDAVAAMLPGMLATADRMQPAMRQNDIAGIVFQRLIADRKTLKTYYTRPESAVFVAHLGVHDDLDWSDPEVVKDYRIADYACGTGGLVLAAYQRVRDLHRSHGGSPDKLHSHMMEESLTACDIMPAAVHLSSSLLSSVAPGEDYRGTRNILYPFGGVRSADGELERDCNGNPVVRLGALDLLDLCSTKQQVVLPLDERMALGSNGRRRAMEVEMAPASQDLVIMNPPFTRHTGEGARFTAFGTSDEEQRAMHRREREIGAETIADWNAGIAMSFAAIADNMVKPGGRIALILPLSAAVGGSHNGSKALSWQKLRALLAECYRDITVVSISASGRPGFAFSAETNIGEVVITGTRVKDGEVPKATAHFVNLKKRPDNGLEAQEIARALRAMLADLTEPDDQVPIIIGSDEVGFVSLQNIDPHRKWSAVRLADGVMYQRVKQLTQGSFNLPYRVDAARLPITRLGDIGQVGPHHRRYTGTFDLSDGCPVDTEYPFLWNRDFKTQFSMLLNPDRSGRLRESERVDGIRYWSYASHLHISADITFNANSTVAAYTQRISGGGSSWLSFKMESTDYERASCAWFNSTLGLMCYWIDSNRTQAARGRTTLSAIPNIATLDVRQLSDTQLAAAVAIFDDLCRERMLPANEAYRDPVRHEIDRRFLVDVLGLGEESVEQLAILRNQWCAEPTVTGTKKTSIQFNT